jgi:hypothetical protein
MSSRTRVADDFEAIRATLEKNNSPAAAAIGQRKFAVGGKEMKLDTTTVLQFTYLQDNTGMMFRYDPNIRILREVE